MLILFYKNHLQAGLQYDSLYEGHFNINMHSTCTSFDFCRDNDTNRFTKLPETCFTFLTNILIFSYMGILSTGSDEHKAYLKMIEEGDSRHVDRVEDIISSLSEYDNAVYIGLMTDVAVNKLIQMDELINSRRLPMGFLYQKDSELTQMFNYHLHNMRESGLLQKLWLEWQFWGSDQNIYSMLTDNGLPESISGLSLGYDNLFLPFVFLCSILIISVMLSIMEKIYHHLCGILLEPKS